MLRSLLERLVLSGQDAPVEPATEEDIRSEVMKHLEEILNSRRPMLTDSLGNTLELPARLDASLLTYGLPDYHVGIPDLSTLRARIEATVKETIGHFEPRLSKIFVEVVQDPETGPEPSSRFAREICIRVRADLRLDPRPSQSFHVRTYLNLTTRAFEVRD